LSSSPTASIGTRTSRSSLLRRQQQQQQQQQQGSIAAGSTATTPPVLGASRMQLNGGDFEIEFEFSSGEDANDKIDAFCRSQDMPVSFQSELADIIGQQFRNELNAASERATSVAAIQKMAEALPAIRDETKLESDIPGMPQALELRPSARLWIDWYKSTCQIQEPAMQPLTHRLMNEALKQAEQEQSDSTDGAPMSTASGTATGSGATASSGPYNNALSSPSSSASAPHVSISASFGPRPSSADASSAKTKASSNAAAAAAMGGKGGGADQYDTISFGSAFDSVVAAGHIGRDYPQKLFHMERIDALALGKAIASMEASLESERQKQAKEMDEALAGMDLNVSASSDQINAALAGSADAKSALASHSSTTGVEDEEAPMTVFDHQSNTDRISQLFNRHLSEFKALEDRWRSQINKLKRRQRQKYRQFVQSIYRTEVSPLGGVHREKDGASELIKLYNSSGSAAAVATTTASPPTTPSLSSSSVPGSSPSPSKANGASDLTSTFLQSIKPLPHATMRGATSHPSSSSMTTTSGPASVTSSELSFRDASGDIVDREIWLGSGQHKSSYMVRLVMGDVIDTCKREFSVKEYKRSLTYMETMYSRRLSAIVLPHTSASLDDIGSASASPRVEQFVKACERSTEYHFKNLRAQMRTVKSVATFANQHEQKRLLTKQQQQQQQQQQPDGSSVSPNTTVTVPPPVVAGTTITRPGLVFVTRHSNLLAAHMVFHVVDSHPVELKDVTYRPGYAPVLDALRQIVIMSSRHGIHTLHIPLVFSDSHRTSSLSFKPLGVASQRRIEAIVRCVRACLTEIATEYDSCLREIVFLVPRTTKSLLSDSNAEPPLVQTCKSIFANVFQIS
jgi:Uncharacterised conserved protein (DUF2362)